MFVDALVTIAAVVMLGFGAYVVYTSRRGSREDHSSGPAGEPSLTPAIEQFAAKLSALDEALRDLADTAEAAKKARLDKEVDAEHIRAVSSNLDRLMPVPRRIENRARRRQVLLRALREAQVKAEIRAKSPLPAMWRYTIQTFGVQMETPQAGVFKAPKVSPKVLFHDYGKSVHDFTKPIHDYTKQVYDFYGMSTGHGYKNTIEVDARTAAAKDETFVVIQVESDVERSAMGLPLAHVFYGADAIAESWQKIDEPLFIYEETS